MGSILPPEDPFGGGRRMYAIFLLALLESNY